MFEVERREVVRSGERRREEMAWGEVVSMGASPGRFTGLSSASDSSVMARSEWSEDWEEFREEGKTALSSL